MADYLNDSPIETVADDQYGIAPFANSLAKSILDMKNPVGTTIALNGPWGSGKSSAVNLIRHELEAAKDNKLVVSDFKCWWYRGEEALALAFLQNLNVILCDALADKVKDLVPKIGRGLLQAGPIIGSAVAMTPVGPLGLISGKAAEFGSRFFPKEETLEKTFQKLAKILQEEDRRFLFIIDDIDRLSPDEALAVFRLVKSVGHLPNVMYLLVFDRILADKVVDEKYPSEGPHFLEKIIQAGFELPAPLQSDLNNAVLSAISEVCGSPAENNLTRFMNIFYDCVVPYMTMPRHVARLRNAIAVTWPAIAHEVSVADFAALEVLRLYEPRLFQAIRANKSLVLGSGAQKVANDEEDSRFEPFIKNLGEGAAGISKRTLQRLFPSLEDTTYAEGFYSGWDAERRVCIGAHFDTYFRLSLSDETLSVSAIQHMVDHSNDQQSVRKILRQASSTTRKNGTTMIPVYLDALNSYARQIDKGHVQGFISVLFELHDEIDKTQDNDRGVYDFGDTSLRCHWLIRRLTEGRFDIAERTRLYTSALTNASLGWLVDFVSSCIGQYENRDDRSPRHEDEYLVEEASLTAFKERALDVIRRAANDGTLLYHADLINILYRWRDFSGGDSAEPRAWADSLLENDDALVIFARELTGESWTHGMGFHGLGDRVARRSVRAQISSDIEILSASVFRLALENLLASGRLDEQARRIVAVFLEAWTQQESGRD